MLGSTFYIRREAQRLVARYRSDALSMAETRAAELEAEGNALAADAWQRIAAAVKDRLYGVETP